MRKKVILVAIFALCYSVHTVQAQDIQVVAEDVFQHIISPGVLHPAHSHLQGVARCGSCHSMTSGVSSEKCLNCHKEIGQRLAAKQGHHGTFTAACLSCHTGHQKTIIRFEQKTFNHTLSQFPLTGKHGSLVCEKCHLQPVKEGQGKRFTYLGLALQCAGCHKNIHASESMSACQSCHQTNGWHLKTFPHGEKTAYPLRGLHKIVPCAKCHVGMNQKSQDALQFKIKNHTSCLACHKDTHQGKLSEGCLSCHTMNGFLARNLFEHDKARFKLTGKHLGVKCSGCHKNNQFKGLVFNDCGDCHRGKTNHKKRIEGCRNCHNPEAWSALNADWQKGREFHQRLNYPLKGAHIKVGCEKCHGKAGHENYFNRQATSCHDCHTDPHKGTLQGACRSCHVETSFKDHTLFDHQRTSFTLDSRHKKIECKTCHRQKDFKQTPATCGDCHLEVTKFARGIWGDRWRVKRIIAPKARIVDCRDCHNPPLPGKVSGETCLICHGTTYKDFFRTRSRLATEAIAQLRSKYAGAKECLGESSSVLDQYPQRLNFIEKNFYHNYRLADQALADMDQQLSEVLHANCQK